MVTDSNVTADFLRAQFGGGDVGSFPTTMDPYMPFKVSFSVSVSISLSSRCLLSLCLLYLCLCLSLYLLTALNVLFIRQVLMPGPVKQVAQGSDTACFLLFNGSVYCSGYNSEWHRKSSC